MRDEQAEDAFQLPPCLGIRDRGDRREKTHSPTPPPPPPLFNTTGEGGMHGPKMHGGRKGKGMEWNWEGNEFGVCVFSLSFFLSLNLLYFYVHAWHKRNVKRLSTHKSQQINSNSKLKRQMKLPIHPNLSDWIDVPPASRPRGRGWVGRGRWGLGCVVGKGWWGRGWGRCEGEGGEGGSWNWNPQVEEYKKKVVVVMSKVAGTGM